MDKYESFKKTIQSIFIIKKKCINPLTFNRFNLYRIFSSNLAQSRDYLSIDSNNPYQNQNMGEQKSTKVSQQGQNMFSQTTSGGVPFQQNYGNAQYEGYQALQRIQQPNIQNMMPIVNLPQYPNFGVSNVKLNEPENFGSNSVLNNRGSINLNTPPINPKGRESPNIMTQPANIYQVMPSNSAPFFNNYQAVPSYQTPFSFPQQVNFQQYPMKPSTPYQQIQNPATFGSSSYTPNMNYRNPTTMQSNPAFPYSPVQILSNQPQSYKPNLRTNLPFQPPQQSLNGLSVLQNMMGKR